MSDETTAAPPPPHAAPAPAAAPEAEAGEDGAALPITTYPRAAMAVTRLWRMAGETVEAIIIARGITDYLKATEAERDRLGLSNAELSSQLTRLDADWERSCATMRAEYESEIAALRAELAALHDALADAVDPDLSWMQQTSDALTRAERAEAEVAALRGAMAALRPWISTIGAAARLLELESPGAAAVVDLSEENIMTNDTTAAPASAADAATLARVEAATSVLSITDYDIYLGRAFGNIRASSLAAIAAAAVRLVEDPYWWLTSDEYEYRCNACNGKGLKPVSVTHAPDCRAMALDAAIRAAGEACT